MAYKRVQMTSQERGRGWVFFALYTFVFPWLVGLVRFFVEEAWAFFLPDTSANFIYHLAVTAAICLVFWTYLVNAWHILNDFLPENLLAFAMGLGVYFVLGFLVKPLPIPLKDPTMEGYAAVFAASPWLTVIIFVFLMPVAEEILYRGLLFGSVKSYSRPLAYVVTAAACALAAVWPMAVAAGDRRYLLNAPQYLPGALALCWCYDKGGSVFAPILLHWTLHAIALFQAVR